MDLNELPYRLRSARQKKRLVKKDRHQIINGRSYRYYWRHHFDKPKYLNKLKNKPLYVIEDEYRG